jgi:hypothetical protein
MDATLAREVTEVTIDPAEGAVMQLNDLQLSLVGGGIGDIVGH